MANVRVGDVSLYCAESGRGPALVLVHGTGASADAWNQVVAPLAISYRTIIYDRRAYQRSSGVPPSAKEYFARHGADLAGLLDALDACPATVVGWSAGSFAALHAAIAQPDRIKQLVLYEPPFHAKANITWPLFKTFALVGLNQALRRPAHAAEAFKRMAMAYSDGRNTMEHLSADMRRSMEKDTPVLLAELAAGTGEELLSATLGEQIKMPVKLLMGERTHALFALAIERLKKVFPRAQVFTIPDANHCAQLDCPEAFVRSLNEAIAA